LRDLAKKAGVTPIRLTRGAAAAGLTDETPGDAVIAAMVADPNLIQRPIVEVGNRAVIARPVEKALEILK
jgi:arsenate reductase